MSRTTTVWRSVAWACALWTVVALAPAPAFAKTEIHFWHAMTGQLGDATNELVKQFNESQSEYEVKPLRKGTYPETLTAAIAAYRQKQAPHVVQVFEVLGRERQQQMAFQEQLDGVMQQVAADAR